MKFSKINSNGVKCDEGFVVQRVDRNEEEYREDNYRLKIHIEDWLTPPDPLGQRYYGIGFILSEIQRWEPPHENETITEEKREQIKQRLIAAMKFWGYQYDFR